MLVHREKSSSCDSATAACSQAHEDPATNWLQQDSGHRSHLVRTLLLITLTTLVVFMHQVFLVSGEVGPWHSAVHYALLAITAALLIGAGFTWTSHRRLHRQHRAVLNDYSRSRQLHKTAGESLRKSESLLECLFGTIADRILVVDSNNRIIKANKVAEQWLGKDPSQREFSEIFPLCCGSKAERRHELNLIEYTRKTQTAQQGRLLRGGADCSMLLSVDTYPVKLPADDSDLVIAIARDVTSQAGHELAACHQEKMAALGILVAGFAHDLGNPLASLSSEIELLREEEPETIRESLATLNGYLERIKRKLSDIVELSKRPDANKQDVDACEAVDYALKLTRFDPRARHVKFNLEVEDDIPRVRIKEDDLVLVLVNLIVNAFDAMPDGGTLTIGSDMTSTGEVLLTLTDTGKGMDAATLHQATQPLFTTKDAIDAVGTGLGLTMVDQLINAAGGRLIMASEPGYGTCITLRLPQATYGRSLQTRATQ